MEVIAFINCSLGRRVLTTITHMSEFITFSASLVVTAYSVLPAQAH